MLTAIRVVTIQNYYIIINYIPYALGYFNFQDPESLPVPFLPVGSASTGGYLHEITTWNLSRHPPSTP